MQNNHHIVVGISFLEVTDLDIMIDLKYKIGKEINRYCHDKICRIRGNIELLQLVYNWTDRKISELIIESKLLELKIKE